MMKVRNLQHSHDYRKYKQENPTGAFYSRRRVFLPASAPPKNYDVTVIPKNPQKDKGNAIKFIYFRYLKNILKYLEPNNFVAGCQEKVNFDRNFNFRVIVCFRSFKRVMNAK